MSNEPLVAAGMPPSPEAWGRELIEVTLRYFPRGLWPEGHEESPEYQRRREAHVRASAEYGTWRDMLRRLRERFRDERFPDVNVNNESLRLQSPETAPVDRCFSGAIELPPRRTDEINHRLAFRVSFVVPCYFIYSIHQVNLPGDHEQRISFEPSTEEVPFVAAVEEEIRRAFPGHTRMSPDVGMVIVPEVATLCRCPGEARIYDCLFSDYW